MNCSKCGKEIADDSKFCEYCGTKVKKTKSRKPFWIVLALCVIALFVGIIIYYENELDNYKYKISVKDEEISVKNKEISEVKKRNSSHKCYKDYRTKYNNQTIYSMGYDRKFTKRTDGIFWSKKGTEVTIYTTYNGYGLSWWGWIPMNCLE